MTTTHTSTPTASPAGKTRDARKTRDGKTTREAILSATLKRMHVHGYHATSLDEVLRDSGVGKGNFYYHFRSKEELGYAILDLLVTGFVERTLEPCFADPDAAPLAQIRCFLDRIVEAQRDRQCRGGCAMGNLAAELSDVHEGFRKRLASVFTTWHARLAAALADAKRRGHVTTACDPEAGARFLVASLEGAILLGKVTKDIGVMEQCVGELKRYLAAYEVRA
jgi:TetR/AcrR family transcriptional repressor of nem operon